MPDESIDNLRERARTAVQRLRGIPLAADVEQAKKLVEALRNEREYELMGRLAEWVSRADPADARNRRLYAQYLIDTGSATAAIDVLQQASRRLSKHHPESAEIAGLLGRAHKQIFFDAGDKTSKGAREALKRATDFYRAKYEESAANTWHGVNLLALVSRARRLGLRIAPDVQPRALADQLVETLQATPPANRDEWYLPTLAEALLGLGDLDAVERNLSAYVAADNAKAFLVASTLRQFSEVWDLESTDERGRRLVDILRARLMQLEDGELQADANTVRRLQTEPTPDRGQLEAVLGPNGVQTYEWMKTGMMRAASVAAIKQRLGQRIGTGFLVRAGDFKVEPPDELLLLTNFHVVNERGVSPGIRPENAEAVFEAADAGRRYAVSQIIWTSPTDQHDASLLRLQEPVAGIKPLPIAPQLPAIEPKARVFVIGHPGGRELAFSFQDNELLDHEGPPNGKPPIPGVCRVHYRAPTEPGSSGSPVFDGALWQVIALHHKGGKIGMPRLNGVKWYVCRKRRNIAPVHRSSACVMTQNLGRM